MIGILSRSSWFLLVSTVVATCSSIARVPLQVLKHADVVTMYQGEADTYAAYGIDVIAWGGTPTPASLEAAGDRLYFGSVGMVTEWTRYHAFAGEQWRDGIAEDIDGNPIQPPWLRDFDYKGIPLYWCCTNRPLFQDYILHRVRQTIEGGAGGLHIDDHLGSAATVYHGGCFCDRCRELFPKYLANMDKETLAELGEPSEEDLPGSLLWQAFQLAAARSFMQEIREYVNTLSEKPIPMSANSYLSFHPHSTDYDVLDMFSSEVPQQGENGKLSDLPLLAYRLAEALERPLAATASGGDWAYIKANGSDLLVRNWIAQAYAAGQIFMTPHRQWCHTAELGTHWFDGPQQIFAPLYQWIRYNADRLNQCDTDSDLVVLFDMRLFRKGQTLQEICTALSAAGISYQFAIIGDPILPIDLDETLLSHSRAILVPEGTHTTDELANVLANLKTAGRPVYHDIQTVIESIHPMVSIVDPDQRERYRCFVRRSANRTLLHVISRFPNQVAADERLQLNLSCLEGPNQAAIGMISYPEFNMNPLEPSGSAIEIPAPVLWTIVEISQH